MQLLMNHHLKLQSQFICFLIILFQMIPDKTTNYSEENVLNQLYLAKTKLNQLEQFSIFQRKRMSQLSQQQQAIYQQKTRFQSTLLFDLNKALCINKFLIDQIKKLKQQTPTFQKVVQLASRIKDSCIRIHKLQIKPISGSKVSNRIHNPKLNQYLQKPIQYHLSQSLRIYPNQIINQGLYTRNENKQHLQHQIPQRISLIFNKSNIQQNPAIFQKKSVQTHKKIDQFVQQGQQMFYVEQCYNPYLKNPNLRNSAFSSKSKASNQSCISQKSNKSVLSKLSKGLDSCQIYNPYLSKQKPRQISQVIQRLYSQMGSLLQRSEKVFSSMKNDVAKIGLDRQI